MNTTSFRKIRFVWKTLFHIFDVYLFSLSSRPSSGGCVCLPRIPFDDVAATWAMTDAEKNRIKQLIEAKVTPETP